MQKATILILTVLLLLAGCSRAEDPLESVPVIGPVPFEDRAEGRLANVDRQWEIAFSQSEQIGVVGSLATCGEEALLLDPRRSRVHRVDLRGRLRHRSIGNAQDGRDEISEPISFAADCDSGRLYVVTVDTVAVFDLITSAIIHRIRVRDGFQPRGRTAIFDHDARTLYFSGLWPALDYDRMQARPDRMLSAARVGLQVSLDSGDQRSMFGSLELGCPTFSGECWESSFDRITSNPSLGWVMAHALGSRVGVYDRDGRLVRVLDISSPLFRRDGTTVSASAPFTEKVAWRQRNSAIVDVFSIGDRLVTVHSLYRKGDWAPKQWVQFDVYANVHTLDGRGLASDVKLPDLPVGRDRFGIFAIDYGDEGRRAGASRIHLVHVALGAGSSQGALGSR